MVEPRIQRRLAAIAIADVVGYSRMMGRDECGTLAAINARTSQIVEPVVAEHQGRIVKLMGDGFFIEFTSAVNAVEAALDLQARMAEANADLPDDRRVILRIGINLGRCLGQSHMLLHQYAKGLEMLERTSSRTFRISALMAGCHARLGDLAAARACMDECLLRKPNFTVSAFMRKEPFKSAEHAALQAESLLMAGLPP